MLLLIYITDNLFLHQAMQPGGALAMSSFLTSIKQDHEKHHGGLPGGWRREASKEPLSC